MTGGGASDGFFAIDSRIWAKVTSAGMNDSVAYLVLSCGTGRDNRETLWSTQAVMTHGGIGWERAKGAIDRLIGGGFIRRAEVHTQAKPRYELATHRMLAEHENAKNPPAEPSVSEQKVIADLQAGLQPTNKASRSCAESLYKRALLRLDTQGVYRLPEAVTGGSVDHSIWLPNAIVMGTSRNEESPARRLRSAGCVWTLRLFVDFYAAHNLRDDGGINPHLIRQNFDRKKIGEQGAYDVLGFKPGGWTAWPSGPMTAHLSRAKATPEGNSPVWESVHLLERMGLLSFVPHIFENDTASAEPIHAYGIGETGEAPLEQEIGEAAHNAASSMALPSKRDEAAEQGFAYLCPILRTKPAAQMIGVGRLTYRPHTRRTKAWFSDLNKSAPDWIDLYCKLAAKAQKANDTRVAKYA
jgi:hypothetical protein